jgi:hypothetical protein
VKRLLYKNGIRTARLALPPNWFVITIGTGWLLLEACRQAFGLPIVLRFLQFRPGAVQVLQTALLCLAAGLFGLGRVVGFHPYLSSSYRDWLKTTCWHVGKPLPLGPVTLTWFDGLLLAVAMGLVWHAGILTPLAVPIAFSATYLFVVAYSLIREGPRGYGYALVCGLGGMLLYGAQPAEALAVAGCAHVVAYFGLRRSLMRLPNYEPVWADTLLADASMPSLRKVEAQPTTAGWPFGYLCPKPSRQQLSVFDAVCIATLAGWLFFCGTAFESQWGDNMPQRDADVGRYLFQAILSLAPLFRLVTYSNDCRPAISLLGRLATGRFLLPRYDRVYAAPLLAWFVIWGVGPLVIDRLGLSLSVSLPIVLTLALLATLVPGPSYRDWVLTCECRIAPRRPQQRTVVAPTRR